MPLFGLVVSALKLGQSQHVQGRHDQAKIGLGCATWLIQDAKIFPRVLCNRDIAQFKCGGGIRIRIKFLLIFYLLVVFLLNSFSFYDLSLVFFILINPFKKKGLGDSCLILVNLGFLVLMKLNFDLYL